MQAIEKLEENKKKEIVNDKLEGGKRLVVFKNSLVPKLLFV